MNKIRSGYRSGKRQTHTSIQSAQHAPAFALKAPERIAAIRQENKGGATMKQKIIRILRECQAAAQKAKQRYAEIERNGDLSPDGMERQLQAVRDELAATMAAGIAEINRLLTEKIEEIDREESKALTEKNADLDFQQRILTKASILKGIDLSKVPAAALEAYLEEFRNYPFAAEYIRTFCHSGDMSSDMTLNTILHVNNGERQRAITKFINDIKAALTESAQTTTGNSSAEALLENRIAYIEAQNEDFSLDDASVAEKMGDIATNGAIDFGFTHIR